MESLVADPSEEFQFLRVGPESAVPPRYRAPVSSLCQIGESTSICHIQGPYCLTETSIAIAFGENDFKSPQLRIEALNPANIRPNL